MNAAIINVGTMVSGDIENDVLEADAIRIEDGKIRAIGTAEEIDANSAGLVVDANGTTLVPGLIDSHTHQTRSVISRSLVINNGTEFHNNWEYLLNDV